MRFVAAYGCPVCEPLHTNALPLTVSLHASNGYSPGIEGHMRRPITIAIAVAITSLLVLTLWEVGMDVTGKDAAVATGKAKPGYPITGNPYLPIQRLEPIY